MLQHEGNIHSDGHEDLKSRVYIYIYIYIYAFLTYPIGAACHAYGFADRYGLLLWN